MAKWKLFDGEKAPQCTSCGMWMSFARYKKKTGVNGRNITNYCPSCGAKMNGIDECLTCKYAKDGEWKVLRRLQHGSRGTSKKKGGRRMTNEWIAFYDPDGRELGAYTLRGTFAGELQATKELLAIENRLKPEDITAKLENRKEKKQ